MATIVAQSPTIHPQRRRPGTLRSKRSLGCIERDPIRFTRAPLLFAAAAFAAGILVASRWWFPPAWIAIAAILQILLAAFAPYRGSRIALIPLGAAWLLVGCFAAEMQPYPAPQTALRLLAQNRPVTITGTITRTSPIRRITSYEPFSDRQVIEQMQSVDLQVRSAAETGEPGQAIPGGVRLSLYASEDANIQPLACGANVTITATDSAACPADP